MKYKINQSRLHTLAYKYILSQLGEFKSDKLDPTIETFVNNDEETVIMNYLTKKNGYHFRISDSIYQSTQDMFSLDHIEMRKILDELVFNLTGFEIVILEVFE